MRTVRGNPWSGRIERSSPPVDSTASRNVYRGAAPRKTVRRGHPATRRGPGRSGSASTPRLPAPEAQPSPPAPKPPCPKASVGRVRPPRAIAVRAPAPCGTVSPGSVSAVAGIEAASRAAIVVERAAAHRRQRQRFTCAVRASSIVTAKLSTAASVSARLSSASSARSWKSLKGGGSQARQAAH